MRSKKIYSAKPHRSGRRRGFGTIEIIVVLGVLGISMVALFEVIQFSFRLSHIANDRAQALLLAREGMEAIRYLRGDSWSRYIAPLAATTVYSVAWDGVKYSTTTTVPSPIDTLFQRQFTVSDVFRDANDAIAASGTLDPSTKKFTMRVDWQVGSVSSTESIVFYLTDLFQN